MLAEKGGILRVVFGSSGQVGLFPPALVVVQGLAAAPVRRNIAFTVPVPPRPRMLMRACPMVSVRASRFVCKISIGSL